jgi:hypothetical protein
VTWSVVLVFVHLLGMRVVGGFLAVAVVARVARRELDAAARVALFRSLGRSYGKRLRQRAVREPPDPALSTLIDGGARQALILRTTIGALTLALLALGAVLAS